MKKFLYIILALVAACCFALSACGGTAENGETYAVIFKCENREDVVKIVKSGETLTDIPELPTVTGYNFSWNKTDFSNITENITVTAVKEAVKSVITLDPDGGSLDSATVNVEYDSDYSLPVPTKTGYRFDKWTTDDGSDFSASGVCKVLANVTLKAVYVKIHTITFKQDGQIVYVLTVDHGSSLEEVPLPNPVEGKTVAWDRTDFSDITKDIVVNAVFGAYKVKYNLGTYKFKNESVARSIEKEGGKLDREYDVVSPNGSVVLLEPVCYGYKFVKWQYNGEDFDGKNYSYAKDIEVVAVWEVDEDSPRWDSPRV